MNIGYENDPVFRALDGTTFSSGSLGKHDGAHESTTDNIVNFNDYYASTAQNLVPFSIVNPLSWSAHGSLGYADGLNRVIDSKFYNLTHKDSTLIVSNLEESSRGKTWVEDLGAAASRTPAAPSSSAPRAATGSRAEPVTTSRRPGR